ncbi:hypothetical protein AMES_1975 [Amycolatopsis mediterranei S699]|uniref:Uncharacterized protein n=2 Tax=Amycolatopsis mediterranei TaxID=33910 RepID=A0A0H3CZN5_AMYMU|nr:hypothetical protein [Amycolatopsis mediterranei]ADJ43798.1 hypothetical protein AMED_1990 [Amycolatopsis mediterranei U32]AEK40509.1 hypothetical protein RAM_10095 [Amycolatopsis mediterranei S699]AFO75511.1 hypothetical protein AMES_1975 [Amycolatopsis mediterranei S699]AGT82640.1 hypothetical protein B737_1976 [Amycolatopsis mediterranei RB]KDO09194.1 hypothetical protein DV26_19740 [Amycolatopsis mediterranei]
MSTTDGGGERVKGPEKPMWEFDGRVASMRRDGRDCGYLFVTAETTEPGSAPAFTLEFLRAGAGDTWYYSDRTDPDDYDTIAELSGGEIDWYGTSYSASWLPEGEAREIEAFFDPGKRDKRRLFGRADRTSEARPHVIPDPGT